MVSGAPSGTAAATTIGKAAAAVLRQLRARLAARPDTEHEMSLNRLVFLVLMAVYLLCEPVARQGLALGSLAVGLVVVSSIFAHILWRPAPHGGRRFVAACADLCTISLQIHLGGEAGSVFYPLLLWTVLGNGFRLGVRWLAVSGGVAVACFAAVIATTPFWRATPNLSAGLMLGLLAIPAYAAALIRKLDDAKRQAEAANSAKTMFLATVSHELRTPLNAIVGALSSLLGTRLDRDQREMGEIGREGAKILLASIEELLDFSRIEAGQLRLNPVAFNLLDLLDEVLAAARPTARTKDLCLAVHVDALCPLGLLGERRYLRDILHNLIGNAVKFTRSGGVLLAVGPAGSKASDGVRFEVIDTGIGIAASALGRIFASFSQADPSILDEFGGTGLGLAICQRLAAALHGTITVDSVPGQGSAFRLQVPLALSPAAADSGSLHGSMPALVEPPPAVLERLAVVAPAELDALRHAPAAGGGAGEVVFVTGGPEARRSRRSAPEEPGPEMVVLLAPRGVLGSDADDVRWHCHTRLDPRFTQEEWTTAMNIIRFASPGSARSKGEIVPFRPARRALRVLVADDNELNRRIMTRILDNAGYRWSMAGDGEAALGMMEAGAADIVIMDVNMPVLNGIDATKLHRAASLDLPHLTIIGLTADATPQMERRCLEAGMDACLIKPIEPDRLLAVLADLSPAASPAAGVRQATATPARAAMPDILDETKLHMLEALGGTRFVAEMVGTFATQAETLQQTLSQASEQDDLFRFRDLAHSLQSGAVNIGAVRVVAQAERLQRVPAEVFARQGAALLAPLREELKGLRSEMERRAWL